MYNTYPSVVFGFHACRRDRGEAFVCGDLLFHESKNSYDWLGHGMYFWENSAHRADVYAKDRDFDDYVVVGAALHLGNCFNLLDSEYLSILKSSYKTLKAINPIAGGELPINKCPISPSNSSKDSLLRELDCAVIELLHNGNKLFRQTPYDSVRAAFWEGEELYPGAGFKEKNHIQLCIRNPNCIKGFFWPRDEDKDYPLA